jgi:5'-nucleotidase
MHKPLRANIVETSDGRAYTSNGTPADCVPLALLQLMDSPPDLVVSGINLGPNLGDDVHYSGTVAGAMEGILNGIPSIAISLADWTMPQWDAATDFLKDFAPKVPSLELPRDTFINVNVPNVSTDEIQGVRVTTQGSRRYKGDITRHEEPQVGVYYWRGGVIVDRSERADTDILAVKDGYISVTPLQVDLTSREALEVLDKVVGK